MKILALGLGVQSTWLYYAVSLGILPPLDAAIFIDTGREKTKTIQYLQYLQDWAKNNSTIPIIVIQEKNLYKDLLKQVNVRGARFASIPAFTKNNDGSTGMLKRQCTYDYKIDQTDKVIRRLLGLKPKQRVKETVEIWKGISLDEIQRMSIPKEKWKIHVYPFCDYQIPSDGQATRLTWNFKMSRTSILNQYQQHHLPIPPKSSCVFCPYQSDHSWYDMKINEPDDFAAAIAVDEAIRDSTQKGINNPAYLHETCKPLQQVDFSQQATDLWHGECSGNCHT